MQEIAPIISAVALVITALGTAIAAIGTVLNAYNLRRIEKNTNSMAERGEAIARELGVAEGKAHEKANPT